MRRFVTLAVLLLIAVPFGVSISGCSKTTNITYCNGVSGVQVGQTVSLDLEPRTTGISINQGAIGSIGAPSAKDCRGTGSSAAGAVYASSDRSIVDVKPTSGTSGLCAGTWNRNTGEGIADYTVCTPNGNEGVAFITASAQGVTSNQVAVYVHPLVTSIVLGVPSVNCTTDPASNCFPPNSQLYFVPPGGLNPPQAPPAVGTPFSGTSCVSQGTTAQLAARTYAGTGGSRTNISNLVGPISFTASSTAVVTIDVNGLATATQPGSTIINASNSQSSSTTGSFFTCPPAVIRLAPAGAGTPPTAPILTSQNVTQDLVATVTDINGVTLNNIALTYTSTTPTTIPTSLNAITPVFPGSATITAICQPPTCNTSNFNQIGLFGNGTPVISNPLEVTATGTNNSTVLYVASTDSQYLLPIDFTVAANANPVRLPYAPNSLVLSEDGSTIYMGSSNELMVFSTSSNGITSQNNTVSGYVLASAPNNSLVVITDPVRQLVYLYSNAAGSVSAQYGGVGTSAQFSPDSSTVYITTSDGRLLVHSTFTGWTVDNPATLPGPTGVAVTVPSAGAYLAETPVGIVTNCPTAPVVSGTPPSQTTAVTLYPELTPLAGTVGANAANAQTTSGIISNNIASTNDGLHELVATPQSFTDIVTNQKSGACILQPSTTAQPQPVVSFQNAPKNPIPFAGAVPTAITAVLPTSDSAFAFVTYSGTGGIVPQYNVSSSLLTNIPLQIVGSAAPIAPIAGVVSSDNQTFYVGTSGDNLVHRLTRTSTGFVDTATPLTPALPSFTGTGVSVPNLLAQKPRKSTS